MSRSAKNSLVEQYNLIQEKPLYCWKVSDSGEVSKFVIERYNLYGTVFTHPEYRFVFDFGSGSTVTYVRPNNIDKFVNNKVFSFIDDDKRAFDIIKSSIQNKIISHQSSVEKYAKFLMDVTGGILKYEENNS